MYTSSEVMLYPSCLLQMWMTSLIAGFKIKDPLELVDRMLKATQADMGAQDFVHHMFDEMITSLV